MKYVITILYFLMLFWSCTENEVFLDNKELLFKNCYEIQVPPYEFNDGEGNIIHVRGDSGYLSEYPDTLNSIPVLNWDSLGIRIITAVIFNDKIRVEGNSIVNTENIVWQWHSGMKSGKEGRVQYIDGKNVINDTIDYYHAPDSLDEGLYYWAVWGWGKSVTRVWYSSRELKFYVLK